MWDTGIPFPPSLLNQTKPALQINPAGVSSFPYQNQVWLVSTHQKFLLTLSSVEGIGVDVDLTASVGGGAMWVDKGWVGTLVPLGKFAAGLKYASRFKKAYSPTHPAKSTKPEPTTILRSLLIAFRRPIILVSCLNIDIYRRSSVSCTNISS